MRTLVRIAVLFAAVGCGPRSMNSTPDVPDPYLRGLPDDCRQALVVRPVAGKTVEVFVHAYERRPNSLWDAAFAPLSGSVGKNGVTSAEKKKEGDGCTPAGTYPLGPAFGYVEAIDTKLTYCRATDTDFWVDDADSPDYNRWVVGKPTAKSYELMKRHDDMYEVGAVIQYNTTPVVPGKGSAIFLHVWSGPGKPTAGCVALEKDHLKMLLRWLRDDAKPHVIVVDPTQESANQSGR